MELQDWYVDEYVEVEGNYPDFQYGNGRWWQNTFVFKMGYGFGFREDFSTASNEHYVRDYYCTSLVFNI